MHTHTHTHIDSQMQTDTHTYKGTHNYTHDFNMFTVYGLSYKIHILCSTCLKCHFFFSSYVRPGCSSHVNALSPSQAPVYPPTPPKKTHTHRHTHTCTQTQDTPLAHKEDAGVVHSQQRILFVMKMGGGGEQTTFL